MTIFSRIIEWIKGVFNKMIGTSELKNKLGVEVAISTEMLSALENWSLMYTDQSPWLDSNIHSAGIPAALSADLARLTTIEMAVNVTGSERADFINAQVNRLMPKLRQQLEAGLAKGGLVMKPYPVGDRIMVDFVQADQFFPVSFDSDGNITACVFIDTRTVGDKYYTRMEFHKLTQAGIEIQNKAYKSTVKETLGTQVQLGEIEDWENLESEATITNLYQPLYGYFKPPMANNIDPTSPMGVSCYSRAVDLIEQADRIWSSLLWEFKSGERALYVDESAFDRDSTTGKKKLPDQRLFRTLSQMNSAELGADGFFHEWSPEFREAAIKAGLNDVFQRIEYACGLAYGTLSDPQSIDKTATEIKMSRQRSYATVKDTQKALQYALDQLIYSIDVWCTLTGLAPAGAYSVTYDFDDSVIVDKDQQFQQDLRLVSSDIMSKVEFRMRNFGEDEQTAMKMLAMVGMEKPDDMFDSVQ